MLYDFLKENQNIIKWLAVGVVILQALIFLLAIIVKTTNGPMKYNYDDELIALRQQIQQLQINRPTPPDLIASVAGSLDQRPSINDPWSTHIRENTGLIHLSSHMTRLSHTGSNKWLRSQQKKEADAPSCKKFLNFPQNLN